MKDPLAFNPFDPAEAHGMWDVAAALRRQGPVVRLANGFVFASRYAAARTVLLESRTFCAQGGFRPDGQYVPMEDRNIGELDPPEHGPIRQLARSGAGGRGVAENLRPFVRAHAEQLLDTLVAAGGGDLITGYGLALTNLVIAQLLGVPLEDSPKLAHWTEEVVSSNTTGGPKDSARGRADAFPDFIGYVDGLIEARLSAETAPQDAITRIVQTGIEDAELPVPMVRMILVNLLLGGTATTRDTIGNLLHELIVHHDLHERLRADRSLVPAAVEESLRLAPPVLFVLRRTTESTLLGGLDVSPGERILVAIASANRDEEIYPEAETFSLDRVDPEPHLSFGHGAHLCVGAALSRMEVQEALDVFLDRFAPGDLAHARGFEFAHVPVPFLFGPQSVDVTLTPRFHEESPHAR
ncbi:MAG: cytochrome P450 [Candidatus Binatia bacterium]|nr:cytochrome P450 [Candidatus Binatia bacterium]